jgi:hypothetical protein
MSGRNRSGGAAMDAPITHRDHLRDNNPLILMYSRYVWRELDRRYL